MSGKTKQVTSLLKQTQLNPLGVFMQLNFRKFFLYFLLLTPLFIHSSVCAESSSPSTQVYKDFLTKKSKVEATHQSKVEEAKAEHAKSLAEITSQVMKLENDLEETRLETDEIRSSIAKQKALHSLLLLDGEWYNFPIFLIMLFLIYLTLRAQMPELSRRYQKQILIILGTLTFLYALGAMAKPLPDPYKSRQKISQNLNLFNRLQGASEVDKLIIKIEQQTKGRITIDEFETSDDDLYVFTSFKKGSFEESFTLAALYLEAGQKLRAVKLLKEAVRELSKYNRKYKTPLKAAWRFFSKSKNYNGVIFTSKLLASSRESLKDYFPSVEFIGQSNSEAAEELLQLLLKKMKQTSDFLAAAIYLHRANRVEESAKMYQKALKTARSTEDYIGLAKYALDNNLPESAMEALAKAFKRARKTGELIAYTKFAFKISHETAELAYEKTVKSARSSNDFLQLAKYSLELGRIVQATAALESGLKKARKVEELLLVIDLAVQMKNKASYVEGIKKAMKLAKRFEDMLSLIKYAYQQEEPAVYNAVLVSIVPKARKFRQLQSLLTFTLTNSLNQHLSAQIDQISTRRLKLDQYRTLRSMLINAKHRNRIQPINMSLTKYTSRERALYALSEEFKSIGATIDANLPIIKLLNRTGRTYKIHAILKFSIENELFHAAREAAQKLVTKRRGSELVKDPNLLKVSTLKPNGVNININTLYAILCQKTGRIDQARAALENEISSFLETYIKEQNGELQGDINTYFYLHQLWSEVGEKNLLNQFDAVYSMVEDLYLEGVKEDLLRLLNKFKKELVDDLNKEKNKLTKAQNKLEFERMALEKIKEKSSEDQIKSIALISRSFVYLFIVLATMLLAGFIAWNYQSSLTAFKMTGFVLKFSEVVGLVLCTNLRTTIYGLGVVVISQIILMLLHIHQEGDNGQAKERFGEALAKNPLMQKLPHAKDAKKDIDV